MHRHRTRNLVPPIYALLVLAGFLIGTTAGIVVVVVGGSLSGILWSYRSGGSSRPGRGRRRGPGPSEGDGSREDRVAARAARRADRR